ncbi:hypothetical protein JXC34_00870, partial [Candidatus Woesearchaeota archaeon]|nr:hypothetical protein [Candidatus Woesearchaeota archaeon]
AIELALEPGESKTVIVTESYRIPFVILIIAIIFAILYYKLKSPVKIRKGISDIKIVEGGVSELKVMLSITNTSKKRIKNVNIMDYVPNIADISKEFVEGTLRPSQVLMHKTKGTVLKWGLEEMAPGEDRLVSYNIKSKLSIIGNFRLPRAKVIFKLKGKEVHAYSNSLGVNAQ